MPRKKKAKTKKKTEEKPKRTIVSQYKGWSSGDRCYAVLSGENRPSLCEIIEFHPKDDIAASVSVTEITTGKYRVAPMMSIAEDAKSAKKLKPKWEKYYAKWKKKNQK
jgi:hypothetical protein